MSTPLAVQDLSYSILQDSRLKQQKLKSRAPIPVSGSIHGNKSLGHKSDVVQSKLSSSVSGSHLGTRRELQGRASGAASRSMAVGGVVGGANSFEERMSKSGRSGKSVTISEKPSRSVKKKKQGGSSALAAVPLRSGLNAGSEASPSPGGIFTPPSLSGTADTMDTTPHLRGTTHFVSTTTSNVWGMITSHTTTSTPQLRGANSPATPHHLMTSYLTATLGTPHQLSTSTTATSQLSRTDHPTPTTGTPQLKGSNFTTPNSRTPQLKTADLKTATPATTTPLTSAKGAASSHKKKGGPESHPFQVKNMSRAHEILADQVELGKDGGRVFKEFSHWTCT